jgi:hypothetical protein
LRNKNKPFEPISEHFPSSIYLQIQDRVSR